MNNIHEISSEVEFNTHLSEHYLVLVDFYASWCEPCKWLEKILLEIHPQIPPQSSIIKIDSEKFIEVSHRFEVRSVPVLILFRKGEPVWRMNGFMMGPDLLEKIRSFA